MTWRMRIACLHHQGWAHSIEIWQENRLAGGLYGLAIGRAFFGESMFSRQTNASKAAMLVLCQQMVLNDFEILDCQVESPHLVSLGASLMPRNKFAAVLRQACKIKLNNFSIGRLGAAKMLDFLG